MPLNKKLARTLLFLKQSLHQYPSTFLLLSQTFVVGYQAGFHISSFSLPPPPDPSLTMSSQPLVWVSGEQLTSHWDGSDWRVGARCNQLSVLIFFCYLIACNISSLAGLVALHCHLPPQSSSLPNFCWPWWDQFHIKVSDGNLPPSLVPCSSFFLVPCCCHLRSPGGWPASHMADSLR